MQKSNKHHEPLIHSLILKQKINLSTNAVSRPPVYIYFFIQIKYTFRSGDNLFTPQETKNETDTAQFEKDKYTHKRKRSIYT